MATPLRPATAAGTPPPPRRDIERFETRLRFEWADPEQRVLLYSWAFAIALGIAWLVVVALHQIKPFSLLPPDEAVEIELTPPQPNAEQPQPTEVAAATTTPAPGNTKAPPGKKAAEKGKPKQGNPGTHENTSTGAIGTAFGTGAGTGTGGITGSVSSLLSNVAIASGSGGTGAGRGGTGGGGTGGKTVLGVGEYGGGGRTPRPGGFRGGGGARGGG